MTTSLLYDVKEHYATQVLPRFRLECPNDKAVMDHRLVQPSAYVGWLPPEGVLDGRLSSSIPCIVVGMDELVADAAETSVKMRVTVVVYDPGHHQPAGAGLDYTPNFEGYRDLLNLMDALAAETRRTEALAGRYRVDGPVALKMYEQQPYPYWYGCLEFKVDDVGYPPTAYDAVL